MNQLPGNAHFIDRLTMARDAGSSKQWTASQKAQLGKKTITITLHFDQYTTLTEASRLMKLSLDKVASLEIPNFKPLRSNEFEIHLKVINPPSEVVLQKVENLQEQILVQDPISLFEFIPTPVLSSSETTHGTKGKVIEDTFQLKRGRTVKEKAVRADTVDQLMQSLQTKKARLEAKKVLEPQNKLVQEELDRTLADIAKYSRRKGEATWGSTNSPRFAFSELGRRLAKQILAPIACNLRMHTVTGPDGKVISSITRSAALTDFSHGEVSLQELKDLRDLQNFSHLSEDRKTQLTKLYLLRGLQLRDMNEVIREIKMKALVGYDILTANDPRFDRYRSVIDRLQKTNSISQAVRKLDPDLIERMAAIPLDDKKLDAIIAGRSRHLQQMALQDLQMHLESRPASSDSMLYCRTSLVDMEKPSRNEKGLVLDEKTQALDMKALFDALDGATLVFDCKESETAFIDEEGIIHMPEKCAAKGLERTKLETAFFNICTQGPSEHKVNTGMQKAINDEALAKLEKRNPDRQSWIDLKASFEKLAESAGIEPNLVVLRTTLFLQEQGGYTGLNCYGGKDRTGYAAALLTHHHLKKLDQLSDDSPKAQEWGRRLVSRHGVAGGVSDDNVDHRVLKLSTLDLSLYGIETFKGKLQRVAHAVIGIFKEVGKRLKNILGINGLAVGKSEGQLYKSLDVSRISKVDVVRKIKRLAKAIHW